MNSVLILLIKWLTSVLLSNIGPMEQVLKKYRKREIEREGGIGVWGRKLQYIITLCL